MYANCKDNEIRYSLDINATGVAVGSVIDLRGSNRIIEQFALMAKGLGTYQINTGYRNGGMETAGAPLGSWTYAQAGTSAITRDTGTFHGGAASAKWVCDGTHGVASLKQTVVTAGRTYTVKFWAKGNVGGEKVAVLDNVTEVGVVTLTAGWVQYSVRYTAASTTVGIASANDAANNSATFFVDDVQVIDDVPFSVVPTTLTSALETSFDGVYWTSVQAVTQANDATVLFVTGKPCQLIRWNVSALTLLASSDTSTDFVRLNLLAC